VSKTIFLKEMNVSKDDAITCVAIMAAIVGLALGARAGFRRKDWQLGLILSGVTIALAVILVVIVATPHQS
jgi:hypothetical protein